MIWYTCSKVLENDSLLTSAWEKNWVWKIQDLCDFEKTSFLEWLAYQINFKAKHFLYVQTIILIYQKKAPSSMAEKLNVVSLRKHENDKCISGCFVFTWKMLLLFTMKSWEDSQTVFFLVISRFRRTINNFSWEKKWKIFFGNFDDLIWIWNPTFFFRLTFFFPATQCDGQKRQERPSAKCGTTFSVLIWPTLVTSKKKMFDFLSICRKVQGKKNKFEWTLHDNFGLR